MANDKFWNNVAVQMASSAGIGAAQVISGITKTNPAVVTYVGADPANGSWVLLSVSGMVEVDRRLARVANVNSAGNTLELEGFDATAYNNFVAGSFQPVTLDKSFTTLSEPSGGGGAAIFEDTTTIHDAKDRQAIVSSTPETYDFVSKWVPGDAALVEANRAFITKTPRCYLITFADATKYAFVGTVAAPMQPTASGRKVTTPISIAVENTGTFYAT